MLDASRQSRTVFLPARFSGLHRVEVNFLDRWRLAGLSLTATPAVITLALRWQCLQPTPEAPLCRAALRDAAGTLVGSLDHDLGESHPAGVQWQSGDEVYALRHVRRSARLHLAPDGYLIEAPEGAAPAAYAVVGLYDRSANQPLPLVFSTLLPAEDYAAVRIEVNQTPGLAPVFRFRPAPIRPCRVAFSEGWELVGYSVTPAEGLVWLRLRWLVRRAPPAPLRLFGHAIPVPHPDSEARAWFDQDLVAPQRRRPTCFEMNIVRNLPAANSGATVVRLGVCTSRELARLPILDSTIAFDPASRCAYLAADN